MAKNSIFGLSDWQRDPSLAKQWEETWEQPHMRLGLLVLLSMHLPAKVPVALGPKTDLVQLQALAGANNVGYFEVFGNIDRMKEMVLPESKEPLREWEHGEPGEPGEPGSNIQSPAGD